MQSLSYRISSFKLNPSPYFLAALVILIVPISGICTDIFAPSLPSIQSYFGSSQTVVQMTIMAYLIGIGIMQLFAGGLSDSFGRKKPFIIASLVFLGVTISIALSTSIYEIIIFRFIQGLCVATMVVPMRAVMSDLFQGKTFHKMVTYMAFGWTIGPIIAPFLGGYLQHYFGWQSCFYFLLGYAGISLLLISIFMPETSAHRHAFNLKTLLCAYKSFLVNRNYLRASLTNGLLYAIVILFMSIVPFLAKTKLNFTPIQYGHLALITGIAWSIGSLGNRFLLGISLKAKQYICLTIVLASTSIFLILSLTLPLSLYTLLIPTFITYVASGTLMTSYFAYALSLFPKRAGSANALLGSFVFITPALVSSFAALLKSTSAIPLAVVTLIVVGIIMAIQTLKD